MAGWRAAVDAHASDVRVAVGHFRELASGLEQGLIFYSGFMVGCDTRKCNRLCVYTCLDKVPCVS